MNSNGEVSCQCKEGWSRSRPDNYPVWGTLMSEGDYFQELADYDDLEDDKDYDVVVRVPRSAVDCRHIRTCIGLKDRCPCSGNQIPIEFACAGKWCTKCCTGVAPFSSDEDY